MVLSNIPCCTGPALCALQRIPVIPLQVLAVTCDGAAHRLGAANPGLDKLDRIGRSGVDR
jgi:hypothetical protein